MGRLTSTYLKAGMHGKNKQVIVPNIQRSADQLVWI